MTNFHLVSEMNIAFGNPAGDPTKYINVERLRNQCKNIPKEYKELTDAFDAFETESTQKNLDDIRDALCDIMVFAYGAFHLMGINADADMAQVIAALETRFVRDSEHLFQTLAYYKDEKGLKVYVEGTFPRMVIKSAEDQGDGEYPKGKFLKAVGYHEPEFEYTGWPVGHVPTAQVSTPITGTVEAHFPEVPAGWTPKSAVQVAEEIIARGVVIEETQRVGDLSITRKFMAPNAPTPASVTAEMATARAALLQHEVDWLGYTQEAIEKFKDELTALNMDQQEALVKGTHAVNHLITRTAHESSTQD